MKSEYRQKWTCLACGHVGYRPSRDISWLDSDATLDLLAKRGRCKRCGARGRCKLVEDLPPPKPHERYPGEPDDRH